MRILAIEKDQRVRELYYSGLIARNHSIQTLSHIGTQIDVREYDAVIVDSEDTKQFLLNIDRTRVVVASATPTAHKNGSWAITKPFYMEELGEILDVIRDGDKKGYAWEKGLLQ